MVVWPLGGLACFALSLPLQAPSALVLVLPAEATAPPVGPLPKGPVTTVRTVPGSLVAVALPHRSGGGLVWRLAHQTDTTVEEEAA
jgi:hypothetical protein